MGRPPSAAAPLGSPPKAVPLCSLFLLIYSGRAKVIWSDRLVLDPDRQIVPDQKMRSGMWGRARSNPDLAFFPRSGFRVVLVFYVCLDFVFSRALSSLENTLFSKLWRAPDRFDFPTEPDRHNFPIGPDRHHFPIAFSCQIEGIARSSQIA